MIKPSVKTKLFNKINEKNTVSKKLFNDMLDNWFCNHAYLKRSWSDVGASTKVSASFRRLMNSNGFTEAITPQKAKAESRKEGMRFVRDFCTFEVKPLFDLSAGLLTTTRN